MKKATAQDRAKQQKSENRAKAGVCVLMCLVILCTFSVCAISAATDVFKGESEVKAVALVLSAAEENELEKQLSKLTPLLDSGFDADKVDAADLLMFVKPSSQGGLYHSFGYEAAVPSEVPDPAMRFKDENGKYKYYKVTKNRVDSILSMFEVNIDHTVNLQDVYYYDGYYYFAHSEAQMVKEGSADITESKRVQDGRYYVTATVSGKTVYVIAGKSQQENDWKIHEISLSPIFDQLGIMIKQEQHSIFDFDIKTKIIEGKTESGTVYSRCVIEYPVFYGKTAGETEANRFFQSVLSYYTQLAGDCDKQYKAYIKKGGKDSALPVETSYKAEVTYAAGDYIGIANEISESVNLIETAQDDTASASGLVVPSKKTMECYIFDTETGAYVTKDSIIGKDYQLLEELLYRIYCGYDYTALLTQGVQDTAEVPSDTNDLGEAIYSGANTICDEGYMFCYINDSGYREDVIIPFGLSVFEIEK